MTKKIIFLALCSLLLAPCSAVEAQQPTKVPRIGYLNAVSPSTVSDRIEGLRQGLRELGYVEGKNIVIEYRYAEGKLDRLPALASELVRLKMDVIVTSGSTADSCHQGSNYDNSHCHGTGCRSGWKRVRRQPRATWGKHYRIVSAAPGAKRKTTGAFEGDRSEALPFGCLRDIDPAGQRTIVKRNRTRGRGVQSEASIHRHTGAKGYRRCIPSGRQGAG